MMPSDPERALILAPLGRDAEMAARVLASAGLESMTCQSLDELCREIDDGAGAVLITTEALSRGAVSRLVDALSRQGSWSELPVLVFAAPGPDRAIPSLAPIEQRAHITILDRPIRVKTLVSATRSAIQSRKRQYQLRSLMSELEERVHERDRFLAILGHELRNPLAAILLASQMLDASDSRLDHEHAALIERQSRHLTRLVDDLLELSRLTAGKIVLQRRVVDLARVVTQSIATLRDVAIKYEVAVHFTPRAEQVLVEGDPVRLEQIVGNLVTNAVKYTPAGGRADVTVDREGDRAVVRIKDTGVGIDPDRIQSIFGLFAQAENAIGRSQGGMGIGLSLVRSLVELHDGEVTVESPGVGRGSEFTVRLPLARPTQNTPAAATEAAPPSGVALDILVVEDNADVLTLLQRKLTRLGHTAQGQRDGEDGAARILEWAPDLAFVDIGLPGIDGFEVARRVRAGQGWQTYLVALSGFGQPEDKRRALDAGFNEHVTKPVEARELDALLARVGRRRAGR